MNRAVNRRGKNLFLRLIFNRHALAVAVAGVTLAALFAIPDNVEATADKSSQGVLVLPLDIPPGPPDAADQEGEPPPGAALATPVETSAAATLAPDPAADEAAWQEVAVRSGDNLAGILARFDIGPAVVHSLARKTEHGPALARLRPGQKLRLRIEDGSLQALTYLTAATQGFRYRGDAEGFASEPFEIPVEKRLRFVNGVIEDSLYVTAKQAGLSDRVIMNLAEIFAWDVDFALQIRRGDSFAVVFEEEYLNGEKLRDGKILAAEFINQAKTHRAVYNEGDSNYYTPEGRSMRKAFLRAPVDFRRISSRFRKSRYHPVLGKRRPHRGVDYAAATGTPIKAAGDGQLSFVGTKGGYGKTVMIDHGRGYSTLYAHMHGYAGGMKNGRRVKQGQIIGYVGSTGLATGPHLHYEFRVNGVHKDPLTVPLPKADSLPRQYRAAFQEQVDTLLAHLDLYKRTTVAMGEDLEPAAP